MRLLKHRCNSQQAIDAALAAGYDGVEIDLVWNGDSIVLSHERGCGGTLLSNVDFHGCVVALNVKEYNMFTQLSETFNTTIGRHFVFDVPGPEVQKYIDLGIPTFLRCSEYEQSPNIPAGCGTIIDSFYNSEEFIRYHVALCGERGPTAVIGMSLRGGQESPTISPEYLICKGLPCNL